jgi:hypothetical protein
VVLFLLLQCVPQFLFLRAAIVISLDVVGRAMAQAVGRLFFHPRFPG